MKNDLRETVGNPRGRLEDMVALLPPGDLGPYADAAARWEVVTGRPAPDHAERAGREGRHRLSARFVEFMMGIPEGWVTEAPISREEQLKACGNGVVPQQATAALRDMLAAFDAEEQDAAA